MCASVSVSHADVDSLTQADEMVMRSVEMLDSNTRPRELKTLSPYSADQRARLLTLEQLAHDNMAHVRGRLALGGVGGRDETFFLRLADSGPAPDAGRAVTTRVNDPRAEANQISAARDESIARHGPWWAIAASLMVAIVVAQFVLCYWLVASSRKKQRESENKLAQLTEHLEAAIETRTEELTSLSGHLLTAREEEKARIARELHDELGSSLTAVNMDLAWVRQRLSDPQLATRLARAAEVLKTTVEAKRRIIHDLRPTILDNLGLSPAIESHAAEFSQQIGVPVQIDVPDELPALKNGSPIALFRIFEEALRNASRHARATLISVSLRQEGSRLVLDVIDNGIGMDLSTHSPRNPSAYGLLDMRERARQMGGSIKVDRGPNGLGTAVHVELPCVADLGPA